LVGKPIAGTAIINHGIRKKRVIVRNVEHGTGKSEKEAVANASHVMISVMRDIGTADVVEQS
jgi:hypothetical protein